MTSQPDLEYLLNQWRAMVRRLERDIEEDRADGLTRTVEAQECSVLAIKACIRSLEDALRGDSPDKD